MADGVPPRPGEPGFIGPVPFARPSDPGATVAPLDVVEVSTAELRDYLTDVVLPLQSAAEDLTRLFGAVPLDEQLFGPIPEALGLSQVHRAAHQIYDATLHGLHADVTDLAEKLRACIETYDCRDADVEADLIRISRSYLDPGATGFRSEAAYQQAITQARAADPTPADPGPPPADATPSPASAEPPAPPPTGTPGF
jgi:hypothetical protein